MYNSGLPIQFRSDNSRMFFNEIQSTLSWLSKCIGWGGVKGGVIGCAIYLYFRVRLAIELNQMQSKPDETKSNVVFGLQFELSAIKVNLIGESSLSLSTNM